MKIAILGGGVAGLSLGYFLKDLYNISFDILEASEQVGGLCRSRTINGCSFDECGVHVIHSKDKNTLEFMLNLLGNNWVNKERTAKIFFNGKWINFPFSSDLNDFDFSDRFLLYTDYLKTRIIDLFNKKQPQNYKEWCIRKFGMRASKLHYLPYASKIYKSSLDDIGFRWIKDIIPPPRYTSLKKIFSFDIHYKSHFYYPIIGGIGALIKPMQQKLKDHIFLNTPAKEIFKSKNGFIVNDVYYDKVINTLPLPELPTIVKDLDRGLAKTLLKLKYLSLYTILIGAKTSPPTMDSWFYIPGNESPFNRVTYLNNLSPVSTSGLSPVVAEMTVRNDDPTRYDESFFLASLTSFEKLGLLKPIDISFFETSFTKYAYILGDHFYEKNIATIRNELESYGLICHGRFGRFHYLNIDVIIKDSKEIAQGFERNYY